MTKKIECQIENRLDRVKVRVVKAPLVDTSELNKILFERTRALVL
jgi:citrate lyase gamma subunit